MFPSEHMTYGASYIKSSYLKAHFYVSDNFWQLKALWKWWKKLFISIEKLFLFSRYLNFCFDFLVM